MSRSSWWSRPRCGAPARSSRRAFTLIEITVWSFLALLFLFALGSLFVTGRRMYESASGSYMIGQEVESGIRFLRQDLQETALVSIRMFPNGADAEKTPGMSLASAREPGTPERFLVTRYGAPDWRKHLFYVLEPKTELTADLVRWEKGDSPTSLVPAAAGLLADDPAKDLGTARRRVLLRNLLRPGVTVEGVGEGGKYKADVDFGGFHPSFVRQQAGAGEELTTWNPAQVSTGEDSGAVKLRDGATRVVEIRLVGLMSTLGSGKPSLYDLSFRVSPRH